MPSPPDPAIVARAEKRARDRETALELVKNGTPKRKAARMVNRHQWTVQLWWRAFEAAHQVRP